ncbi:MAG: dihydropteroate synthase [Methanomassiliicoccaceae archaeon]|nr:dihydropteroate synthase [Methanomassiliicoccaceae archaeon]
MITIWSKGSLTYDVPKVMGIVNITPDSFSDTVRYTGKDAVRRIFELEDEGADIIDVGGESTRPGAVPVSAEEEMSRIIGVIEEASPSLGVPISADTMHPETALAALNAGASIINDVSGLRDRRMITVAASAGVPVVITHMYGTPGTMHRDTMSGNVAEQISSFFDGICEKAETAGIKKNNIVLDPGIGFGKTFRQNAEIIDGLRTFRKGYPLLTGTSMKSFLGYAYPDVPIEDASIRSAVLCVRNGADIVRVHNVKGTKDALKDERF